jgi:hypothetical protein
MECKVKRSTMARGNDDYGVILTPCDARPSIADDIKGAASSSVP